MDAREARGPEAGVDRRRSRLRLVLLALCITEITSWGILYYAFPVMLSSLTGDTGWSAAAAMGAFSTGAITAAAAGVGTGRLIDRYGPRPVMTAGSVLGVVSVLAIAAAPSLPWFFGAWVLAGLAQSAVLYPPAFAALTGWFGRERVRALTTLTLIAGLASTVFAPLTAVLLDHLTWRAVYVVLAFVLAAVTIPLHGLVLTPSWPGPERREPGPGTGPGGDVAAIVRSPRFATLSVSIAAAAFGMYAATVNLVALLTARGMSTELAAVALGLCGVGQVLGRLGYARLTALTTPRARTVAVIAGGAVATAALGQVPGPAAVLIAVAIAAGGVRGILTLVQATAVADRWGTRRFGQVNGVFIAPVTAVVALAPGGGILIVDLVGGFPVACVLLALVALAAAGAVAVADRGGADRSA